MISRNMCKLEIYDPKVNHFMNVVRGCLCENQFFLWAWPTADATLPMNSSIATDCDGSNLFGDVMTMSSGHWFELGCGSDSL